MSSFSVTDKVVDGRVKPGHDGSAQAIAHHLTAFQRRELICPSCQSAAGARVEPSGKSPAQFRASCARSKRGVSRSSRTLGGEAVDAFVCERRTQKRRTAKSCGPGISTLMPSRQCFALRGQRRQQARSPGRARRKPLKPFAQGMLERIRRTCSNHLVCFLARETTGALERPAFPAPSDVEGRC